MFNNGTLDKSIPVPLHYQLKQLILDEIKSGRCPSGSQIPTELEISEHFDISRSTVQKAINNLVTEGYLTRIRSKGTFVSKPKITQQLLSPLYRYHDAINSSGSIANVEVLKLEVTEMPEELVKLGGGKTGDQAILIYRRWKADEDILERCISYLPYNRFHFLLEEEEDFTFMHDIWDRDPETKIHRIVCTIEAVPACEEDIKILKVTKGSAIQKVTTVRYDRKGEILDLSYACFRGDKNLVQYEITIPE